MGVLPPPTLPEDKKQGGKVGAVWKSLSKLRLGVNYPLVKKEKK